MQHRLTLFIDEMFFAKHRKVHHILEIVITATRNKCIVTSQTYFCKKEIQHFLRHITVNNKSYRVSGFTLFKAVGNNFKKTFRYVTVHFKFSITGELDGICTEFIIVETLENFSHAIADNVIDEHYKLLSTDFRKYHKTRQLLRRYF
ncbi:hypothetical protein SDC9_150344 [bioreactor metagenome]|uniref:Uncharacterized protein n=1 Tax=bioreactor metagenome TaxID=1076179 RepID=A0A645EM80_9ZZZZ